MPTRHWQPDRQDCQHLRPCQCRPAAGWQPAADGVQPLDDEAAEGQARLAQNALPLQVGERRAGDAVQRGNPCCIRPGFGRV